MILGHFRFLNIFLLFPSLFYYLLKALERINPLSEKIKINHQSRQPRAKAEALRIAYMSHNVFSFFQISAQNRVTWPSSVTWHRGREQQTDPREAQGVVHPMEGTTLKDTKGKPFCQQVSRDASEKP